MNSQQAEIERISKISQHLFEAGKSIKILTHLNWPASVKAGFFKKKAKVLPQIEYTPFHHQGCSRHLMQAKKLLGPSAIDDWLASKIDDMEQSVAMLESRGSKAFYAHSAALYGTPSSPLKDGVTTPLKLADQFDQILNGVCHVDLGAPPEACILATTMAEELAAAAKRMFGDKAPPVKVVKTLSANALAGTQRVRVRQGACFTDLDVKQLIEHEIFVHVATGFNGMQQPVLKFMGCNTPLSTKTQEGLAVFAELITGSIDLSRMRRLADRVIAIQMAIDGADFLDVYHFFLERTDNPDQSFENARRVFRGGVLTGGAPFTKDVVYLDGLISVHNFLRALVTLGRADCLRLLFCGKLDIEDLPMLGWLTSVGICKPAKYLPPWATDLRFLLCYLAYSAFLNQVRLGDIAEHYKKILQDVPKIPDSGLYGIKD